jgi:hypothetical protein
MFPNSKSNKLKVVSTGKIDGGAYRIVELPNGSGRVEEWTAEGWVPGGASFGEVYDAPAISPSTAVRLGIPIEDLQEKNSGSKPLFVMIDPPGPFSSLTTWEQHLAEVKTLPPNTLQRDQLIDEAEQMIARKRRELENASEVPIRSTVQISPEKKASAFKPDYGLRLLKDGYSPNTDLYFYEFRLYSISVLGVGDYSTMVEKRYDGETHALSLDFNGAQLEKILAGAEPDVTAFVRAELSKDPISSRTIELDPFVSFAVRARMGRLETASTNEQFVPLVAQEILPQTSNPAGDGLKTPMREWDDEVLDQALKTMKDRTLDKSLKYGRGEFGEPVIWSGDHEAWMLVDGSWRRISSADESVRLVSKEWFEARFPTLPALPTMSVPADKPIRE